MTIFSVSTSVRHFLSLLIGWTLVTSILIKDDEGENGIHRRLGAIPEPVVDRGNNSFLPDQRTLYAALLHLPPPPPPSATSSSMHRLDEDSHFHHQHHHHPSRATGSGSEMQAIIPAPLRPWPFIEMKPCPQYSLHPSSSSSSSSGSPATGHRLSDTGHGLSHFQIWTDFVFFDLDVLEARVRPTPEYVASTTYSSVSGHFQAFPNGTLTKNGVPYLEDDLLVVLEDNLVLNISHAHSVEQDLREVFLSLKDVDVVWLTSCPPLALQDGICNYAYAATRRAYRSIIEHFDICGRSLESQLVTMEHRKLIRMRTDGSHLFHPRPAPAITSSRQEEVGVPSSPPTASPMQ
eukprot:gene2643-2887_t